MDIVERLNGPIADAVHRLCRGSWRRDGEVLEDKDRPKFSIPASYERDSDLIATQGVKEAAAKITRLRAEIDAAHVEKLEAKVKMTEAMIEARDLRARLAEAEAAKADAWDEGFERSDDARDAHN